MIKEHWSRFVVQLMHTSVWLWVILLLATLLRLWPVAHWQINGVALLLSLILVLLTWYFAAMLADGAHLSPRGKERFMVMATLISAAPPLYATTLELNVVSSATLVIVLLLVLYSYVIGRRWIENYSNDRSMSRYIFTQFFRLTSIVILFGICGSLIGYYTQALIIVLPFVLGAIFTIPYMATQYRDEIATPQKHRRKPGSQHKGEAGYVLLHICMLALIAAYFMTHLYAYVTNSPLLSI